jgi:hypothetical protein
LWTSKINRQNSAVFRVSIFKGLEDASCEMEAIIIPAKARVSLLLAIQTKEIPAFAGMTA